MKKLKIVMYHYVRNLKNSRYPKIKGLDYSLFKQQIEFFKQNFNVVTMEEVIAAYNEGYNLPENALLLTFDDGYVDHYIHVYPILKEYNMQGSFFSPAKTFKEHIVLDVNKIHFILASTPIESLVQDLYKELDYYRGKEFDYPSNEELFKEYGVDGRFDPKEVIFFKRILQVVLPERLRNKITKKIFDDRVGINEDVFSKELYMNYNQMKCMKKDGMFFGVHGYDHYWMNKLTPEELKKDIDKGLEYMSELIDPSSWVINYPCGSYSDDVIKYVRSVGCTLGLSTDVNTANQYSDKYKLPRLDTNDFPPKSKNFVKY